MKRLLFWALLTVAQWATPVHAQSFFYDYQVPNNVGTWVGGMHFFNNTTGWACSIGGNIHRTTDGGVTWQSVNYGGTSNLNDIFFIDANTGWAVGVGGTIIKSTDGGVNWTQINSGTTLELSDVTFVDAQRGWASAGAGLGGGDNASTILRTVDGGASWTPVTLPVAARNANALDFLDANVGYATGDSRSVFKTVDGGLSWTSIPVPTALTPTGNHTFYALDAIDANTVVIGGSNNSIYRTTNGGTTWNSVTGVVGASQTRGICFWSATQGVAVGNGGRILTTTDGGATWTSTQPLPTAYLTYALYACAAPSSGAVYVAGQRGIVAKSTDGGLTWGIGTYVDHAGSGLAIAFQDETSGIAGGFLGVATRLLQTTNGGNTWSILPVGIPGSAIEAIEYVAPNTIVLSNSSGTSAGIYRSTDNGQSFQPMTVTGNQSLSVSNACLDIFKVNDNLVVGCGRQGRFFKSTNGGVNWTVSAALNYAPSFTVTGVSPTVCAGSDGSLAFAGLDANQTYVVSYLKNYGPRSAPLTYTTSATGTFSITGLTAGFYNGFEVSLNGCKGTVTTNIALADPGSLTFNVGTTAPTACGAATGQITLTGTGTTGILASTTYSVSYWYNGTTVGPTNYTTNASRQIILTGLSAGVYSAITVGTGNCLRPTATATLIQDPSSTTFTTVGAFPSSCGVNDGGIIFNNLTANTNYSVRYMLNGTEFGPVSATSDANGSFRISNLASGVYNNIRVTNPAGCVRVAELVGVSDYLSPNLNGIHFVNENIGYIVGDRGAILKTTDGGATWTRQFSSFPTAGGVTALTSVFFTDAQNGHFCGISGSLYKTTDGGNTWVRYTTTSLSGNPFLQKIHFYDKNNGIVFSSFGTTFTTRNGGNTWEQEFNIVADGIQDAFILNRKVGYVTGSGNGGFTIAKMTRSCFDVSIVVTKPSGAPNDPGIFCTGEAAVLTATLEDGTYRWSTGATTRSITVNQAGAYTVSVTFPEGCVKTASAAIGSVPVPAPVCNDISYVGLDEDCAVTITDDMVLEGTYYCDYRVELTSQNGGINYGNTVTTANVGQTLRAKVTHIATGNSCWGLLKVEDKLKPKLTCKDITLTCANRTYDPNYLRNTLGLTEGVPAYSDCQTVTLTYIDGPLVDLDCDAAPINGQEISAYFVRKWTATDASGNASTCEQFIYFKRLHIPDLNLPSDVTLNCGTQNLNPSTTGAPYYTAFGQNLLIYPEGHFCELQAKYADQIIPVCDGTYKILRKWTILDWCRPITNTPPFGNPLYHTQVIKVVDEQGPTLRHIVNAPAFSTVAAAAAGGFLEIRADGSDPAYACGGSMIPSTAPDTFYVWQRAIEPLMGTVTQRIQCGILTGPRNGVISYVAGTEPDKCCVLADLPDLIVEDACSRIKSAIAIVTQRNPETGAVVATHRINAVLADFDHNNWWTPDTLAVFGETPCLPIGEHDVTYTVEDDCGNQTTAAFKLVVMDLTPPTVVADAFTQVAIGLDDRFDCYPGSAADSIAAAKACKFNGVAWISAKTFDDGSFDNCGPVKLTIRRMPKNFINVGGAQVPVYSDFIESLNKEDGCPRCEPNDGTINSTLPSTAFTPGTSQVNSGFDPFGPVCSQGFSPWKPDEYQRAWLEQDSIKFYCDEVGTRDTVILRVYQTDVFGCPKLDAQGNRIYSEAMIAVDIVDKVRPTCTSPAHVTVSCENFDPTLWAYGKAKGEDNCCLDTTKDYLGQCGMTHSANYNQFDTSCNKGTILRTFRVYDCHDNFVQCTQRVVVTYEEDYYVRFPDDRIVTVCDGSGVYGAPTLFGEDCELLAVSFKDDTFTVVPDACYKIERTWKVINWCTYDPNCDLTHVPNPTPNATVNNPANFPGPIVSDINGCDPATVNNPWRSACVRINPTDAANTSYTRFWQLPTNCWPTGSKFNGYSYTQIIKIVDGVDPVMQCAKPDTCDITDNNPDFWNVDYWWDPIHGTHDLCEMPIDLKVTATDACSGATLNFRYLLFLDLDANGTMETVVSSSNLPGVNTVMYGNANNPNYSGGQPRQFDHRAPPTINSQPLDWYRFAIQVTRSGANATAAVRFNTVRAPNTFVLPQLPHGKHKIKWIVEDGCGNETVCEYPFEIRDCKAPTVVCKPLSVNIMPTGMITLWASDFLEYTFDNCTPSDQLEIAISAGEPAPSAFPRDPVTRLPITNVSFTCANLGANVIQLWAEDKAGNADYCQVVLLVQDNAGNCVQKATVAGELKTPGTQGVEEGNVQLAGSHPAFPPVELYQMSNQQGNYQFSNAIPLAGNYTLTPEKTDNPLNGVTTLDLALISKHILGVQALNTPYNLIAADANKSGTVTTFDVVELRKLILGIYDELPNNKSWRFVSKNHVFANPANPFTPAFPESSTVANIQASQMGEHFVGVKVGDVNGTAVANNLMSADDRTVGTTLFDVEDRAVKAGEVFEVKFKSSGRVPAYQFTMNHAGLEVVDIVPGAEMGLDNFGVFSKDAVVTTSWNGDAAQAEFTVKFRAAQNGLLNKMLGVSSRITKAVAYVDGEQRDVAFRFNNGTGSVVSGVGFELYQNSPNPFTDKTVIGFHLPEATNAVLSVYDEAGKMVHRQEGAFAKGVNRFVLERSLVPTTGLLYYTVETATDSATRKMVQVLGE